MNSLLDLVEETCVPIGAESLALSKEEVSTLLYELPGWTVSERDGIPKVEKVFAFRDFSRALAFADRVGAMADREDHHPAVLVEWGHATVSWWTHRIRGLHRNDFICAAKTDAIYLG